MSRTAGEIFQIKDMDNPAYDPHRVESMMFGDTVDPYPVLRDLRHQGSVHPIDYRMLFTTHPDKCLSHLRQYTVLGYDDVETVMTDPETYSMEPFRLNLGVASGPALLTLDPPSHTRYRRIFQSVFSPKVVESWKSDVINPVINELIDSFSGDGVVEMVSQFTRQYPFNIIYRQLNLPEKDIAVFQKLSVAQLSFFVDQESSGKAGSSLSDFFREIVKERRKNPLNDLTSRLALTESDGEFLPDDIIVAFLCALMAAAADTTYRTTGSLLVALLDNPRQLQAINDNRLLISRAIDEVLRWNAPILLTWRMNTRDVTLGGRDISAGSLLNVSLGSANRDETRFKNPDQFDIFREKKVKTFGFGSGPHYCLGAYLAKTQMICALNAILDRLPNIRYEPGTIKPDIVGFMQRTPRTLRLAFDRPH